MIQQEGRDGEQEQVPQEGKGRGCGAEEITGPPSTVNLKNTLLKIPTKGL